MGERGRVELLCVGNGFLSLVFICSFITQPCTTGAHGPDEDEDEDKDEAAGRARRAGAYDGGMLGMRGSIGFLLLD